MTTGTAGQFENPIMFEGVRLSSGCYNSTISNCVILDDALIKNTSILAETFVDCGAAVIDCGVVKGRPGVNRFGNGTSLKVGVEIGGREIVSFDDMTFSCK